MNRYRLLADAKARALELAVNYVPPKPVELKLPGAAGGLAFDHGRGRFHQRGMATDHDMVVSGALAEVLSGGEADIVDTRERRAITESGAHRVHAADEDSRNAGADRAYARDRQAIAELDTEPNTNANLHPAAARHALRAARAARQSALAKLPGLEEMTPDLSEHHSRGGGQVHQRDAAAA